MRELDTATRPMSGFLSPRPLLITARGFEKVSWVASKLPKIIKSGTAELRKEIESLPLLDTSDVSDPLILRALLRDYHYLQSAYARSQPAVQTVPESIAVPSYTLARRLGRKSMLSYASMVLDNWWQVEPDMPFTFEHVRPIRTFTDTDDERGFIVPHTLIEHEARGAVDQIEPIILDVQGDRASTIIPRLYRISSAFEGMQTLFAYITKHCDPKVYFEVIRPWMDGFKEAIFEGVDEIGDVPQSFIGPSGAQSSILPAIDAILCIQHDRNYFSAYLEKLRDYMPPEHVRLIERAERSRPLRAFVIRSSDTDLRQTYCSAVQSVRSFRLVHRAFTKKYISAYSSTARGTGGSQYDEFVDQYIKDTEAALL
jgi:indoleamine 2,3-dioxygenase